MLIACALPGLVELTVDPDRVLTVSASPCGRADRAVVEARQRRGVG
ncbi:hypothetical protein [Nocardia sp. NRRL S-836]|nr:hypothetical protein [Nocardia sp. NRRL S-836]